MSELARRIDEARSRIRPNWSDERARVVERAMLRRRARRTTTRVALAAATAVLLVVGVGARWLRSPSAATGASAGVFLAELAVQPVRLEDGSRAAPLDRATVLHPEQLSPSRVVMTLARGRAAFDVTPNPAREFVVHAGAVDVKVLGTAFSVDRRDANVLVSVQRGRVRVTWADGTTELTAGQGGTFPPPLTADQLPGELPSAESDSANKGGTPAPPVPKSSAPSNEVTKPWRQLATQGDFADAYSSMKREGASAVRNDVADLLLAADVARMSGHSSDAVATLRRILTAHRSDPRASLAAFTLGRVLLDELGRPGEAAAAFADTRSLAPGGALAQDALAREVEALSKAGDTGGAHQRALEYLRLYPDGRRSRSVRRYGGVE